MGFRQFGQPFGGGGFARPLGQGGGNAVPLTYAQYIATLAPVLWYKFNETSGTTVINYGSGGATYNGTLTPGTGGVGQVGADGTANEAYLFDGADTKVNIPAGIFAAVGATYTVLALVKPTSAGENSLGVVWQSNTGKNYLRFNSLLTVLDSIEVSGTINAQSTTNVGQSFTLNSYQWAARTYDNTGVVTGDRKIRIFKGISAAFAELTYATQVAMTGTRTAEANSYDVGNNSSSILTWAGLMDEIIFVPSIVTPAQMMQLIALRAA